MVEFQGERKSQGESTHTIGESSTGGHSVGEYIPDPSHNAFHLILFIAFIPLSPHFIVQPHKISKGDESVILLLLSTSLSPPFSTFSIFSLHKRPLFFTFHGILNFKRVKEFSGRIPLVFLL